MLIHNEERANVFRFNSVVSDSVSKLSSLNHNENELNEKKRVEDMNKDTQIDYKNELIFIRNEQRKNLMAILKSFEKPNNVTVPHSTDENSSKKSTELFNISENSLGRKSLVYHDSFKMIYEDTNMHVAIPTPLDENENHDCGQYESKSNGEIHWIDNLSEHLNNHLKQLNTKNKHIFLENVYRLTEILNFNFMSIWKNKDQKKMQLFHHHDNFLTHILKSDKGKFNGKMKQDEINDTLDKKLSNFTCNQLCQIEKHIEMNPKFSILENIGNCDLYNRVDFSDLSNMNEVPCVYEKIKKVECHFEPGNHCKFVYPPSYRMGNIKELSIRRCNILFDSKFESGNLQYVTKEKNEEKYFLFLNNDVRMNDKKNQWFYFSASYVPDEYFQKISNRSSNNTDAGNRDNTTVTAGNKKRAAEEFLNEINKNIGINGNDSNRFSFDSSDKFSVTNVKKMKTPFTVRFQIVNMSKPNFLYKEGYSPLVYSKWKNKLENKTWERTAYDVKYTKNTAGKYFNIKKNCYENMNSNTYSLEFSYDFLFPYDTVYFSSSYPYTYSYLMQYLSNIQTFLADSKTVYYRQEVLCKTNCGLDCPVLAITNFEKKDTVEKDSTDKENEKGCSKGNFNTNEKVNEKFKSNEQSTDAFMREFPSLLKRDLFYEMKKKKVITTCVSIGKEGNMNINSGEEKKEKREKTIIFLSARVHPGESNSSYAMHGFLSFLISENIYANILRENYIFIIIPMLNIDGVMLGNNRYCSKGFDLNRQWYKPIMYLHATIYAAKSLIKKLSTIYKISLFCDFHGHSTKYNCFLFGNSESNVYIKDKKLNHIFPRIVADSIPWYSLEETKFKMESDNKGIARHICGKEFNIACSYTLEMSLVGVMVKNNLSFSENIRRDILSETWEVETNKVEDKTNGVPKEEKAENKLENSSNSTSEVMGKEKETNKKDYKIENENEVKKKDDQYEFFYYDDNMFLMTGVGFGISLFKFMNFLHYYNSNIYEIEEEKSSSLNSSFTRSIKRVKTNTSEESNSVRNRSSNTSSILFREKLCKSVTRDHNKEFLFKKGDECVEITKGIPLKGINPHKDTSNKFEENITKEKMQMDKNSSNRNIERKYSGQSMQIEDQKQWNSISENECVKKRENFSVNQNKMRAREHKSIFNVKPKGLKNANSNNLNIKNNSNSINTTNNTSNLNSINNLKKKNTNTNTNKTENAKNLDLFTNGLKRSVTESGITNYVRRNKANVINIPTICHFSKVKKKIDALISNSFLVERNKIASTTTKMQNISIDFQKGEKKSDAKRMQNEKKKEKESVEKKEKTTLKNTVMKPILNNFNKAESLVKYKNVTKERKREKAKNAVLKSKMEKYKNMTKNLGSASKLLSHSIMCKLQAKNKDDIRENKRGDKHSNFFSSNDNSNISSNNSSNSDYISSDSSTISSSLIKKIQERITNNRIRLSASTEIERNSNKKMGKLNERKDVKEKKFMKLRKSKSTLPNTSYIGKRTLLKLKGRNKKETKKKGTASKPKIFNFHNNYKLDDYASGDLMLRLIPELKKTVKKLCTKNENNLKPKSKKRKKEKKSIPFIWEMKRLNESKGGVVDEHKHTLNGTQKKRHLEKCSVGLITTMKRKKFMLKVMPTKKGVKQKKKISTKGDYKKDDNFSVKGREKKKKKKKKKSKKCHVSNLHDKKDE